MPTACLRAKVPTACTLAIIDKKQKLVNSRKLEMSSTSAPVLMERSTVFKTPTRCSSFGNITSVPSSTPRTVTPRQFNAHTPMSARKTPGDRFIPSRAGTDLQYSAHKVRCGRRSGRSADAAAITLAHLSFPTRPGETICGRGFYLSGVAVRRVES